MKDKIEQLAIRTVSSHRDSYEALKHKWTELHKRYENKMREGSISSKTESKVALGGAYSLVENALPRLLARDPKYKYLGRENQDEQVAELYEQFSEYQFDESQARDEVKEVVRWGLITGLAGWKMGWNKKEKIIAKNGKEVRGRRVTNPLFVKFLNTFKLGNDVKVEERTVTSNYTFKAIKPHDLIWSTEAKNLKEARVFGHSDKMRISDIKDAGFDVDPLVAKLKESDKWEDLMKEQDGVVSAEVRTDADIAGDEMADISELYVSMKNEEGIIEAWVCWVGNLEGGSPVALKTIPNPYDMKFCPMGIFRPVDRAGKFYGFGIIETAIGAIDAEEDTLNISLEAMWTATVPPLEVNASNLVNPKEVTFGPRSINYVRNLGQSMAVMNTPRQDTSGTSLFVDYLNRAKQNISGITDYQTGSDQTKGSQTLGEIQIKTQESNARINQMLKNLEQQVFEPMGRFALWMNQQYLFAEKKIFFRILGRKGQLLEKAISSKEIEAIKDVIISSGSSALVMQQAELQKWVALLNQVYLEERSPVPTKINKLQIWEKLFEMGLQIKDPETYLPSLKEIEEEETGDKVANMKKAIEENNQPIIARVHPDDIDSVHLPIHQAEIVKRKNQIDKAEQVGVEVPEEVIMELQMLVRHVDDHMLMVGGQVPNHSANMQVGQGINDNPNAQQTPQQ